MKRILLLFTAILAAGIMTLPIIGAAAGDGYLLKRSPEETCHSCHKTNVNTPSTDANWNNAIKMHSAEVLGTCSNSTFKTRTECLANSGAWTAGEWNASGGWGVSGGKYGEFLCTTCHTAHNTKNIYLIKEMITAPNSPTDNLPGSIVDFRVKQASPPPPETDVIGRMGRAGEDRSSLPDPKTTRVCEVCHTYNSVSASNGVTVHAYNMPAADHMGTTACTVCHSHKTAFSGAGCDGCHNSPPAIGKHSIHFGSGSVDYGSTTIQSTTNEYRFSCSICHNGTHNNSGASNPHSAEVIFAGVAIQDPVAVPAAYTAAANDTDNPGHGYTFNYSDGTCSNVYCHGNYPGSGNNALPTFTTGSAACGTCHGVYDAANTTDYPDSGSHERHVTATDTIGSIYNRGYQCTLCHNNVVAGVTSYTISKKSKHVSGLVDWQFDTNDSRLQGGSESYSFDSGTEKPSDGVTREYGTCNNVYCHSIVQTADGSALTGAEGEYILPTWGSPSTCNCHNADGEHPGTYEIASGSHTAHLDYVFNTSSAETKCTICHKWNASAIFDDCGQCHQTTEEKTYHVNGNVDVIFDTYWGNGTYYGTPTPGDGYGACSNVYCHSIVQTADGSALTGAEGEYMIPTWGSPSTCNCHDADAEHPGTYEIASGSHTAHLDYVFNTSSAETKCTICHKWNASASFDECDQCHQTTEEKTYHVNGAIDVSFDTYWGNGTYNGASNPGNGYSNCSNAYCHSNGTSVSTGTIPANATAEDWGTTAGPLACTACHGNPPDYLNGSPKANSHLAAGHVAVTCNYCHVNTTTDGTTIADKEYHVNRYYNVDAGAGESFTYTFNASGGTCASVSCHIGNATRTWGGGL